jgi:hypothetical protein
MTDDGGPLTRRWTEQRWLLDNTIRAVGMDWDQPRSIYLSVPCGPEANADFAAIRQRITKLADASPAFEAVARRREARAQAAEGNQDRVTARENYFMASIHWAAAQWPIDTNNEPNRFYNGKKRECYAKYATLADHHVEAGPPLSGGLPRRQRMGASALYSMRVTFEPLVGYANSMCLNSVARIPERMASAKRLMTSPASLPRI